MKNKIKEKLKKILMKIIFGSPIKGEMLGEPSFRTVYPESTEDFNRIFTTKRD